MNLSQQHFFTSFLFFITTLLLTPIAHAESPTIKTSNGNELGISVSSYSYEEPSLGMSNKGDKFGVNHLGAKTLNGEWFIKDDVRFAYGSVDYVGSGYQPSTPDWYLDARGLIGLDIQGGNAMYSPFIGIGYRYLFNDLRGYSSSGAIGYRRESNYLYVPIGLTHRFKLDESAVLATTLEFDHLLSGRQVTHLSDLIGHSGYSSAPDVTNGQDSGFGLRADMMYEMDDWAFGPFLNIWRIKESDAILKPITKNGSTAWYFFSEPENRTSEFGLRLKFMFR
jgi:hypothetical protein